MPDDGTAADETRSVLVRLRRLDRGRDGGLVVTITAQDLPPIGLETRTHVFGEGPISAAVDGDLVVVVEDDHATQPEVSSQ